MITMSLQWRTVRCWSSCRNVIRHEEALEHVVLFVREVTVRLIFLLFPFTFRRHHRSHVRRRFSRFRCLCECATINSLMIMRLWNFFFSSFLLCFFFSFTRAGIPKRNAKRNSCRIMGSKIENRDKPINRFSS